MLRLLLALALSASGEGFTLNAEVLERYGYTLDGYNALSAPDKRRVEEWIRSEEDARLAALRRRALERAQGPPPPLEQGWDAQRHAAFARLKAAASGRDAFDGPPVSGGSPVPRLELFGLAARPLDGSEPTGAIRRFQLRGPGGATLEAGALGLEGRSPLVGASPYLGVEHGGRGTGSALDWSWRARASMIGLSARLYHDDAPDLDRRIDSGIDALGALEPVWGIKPQELDGWRRSLSFSTERETTWMFLGSALGRVGRAYGVLPRLDVGWSAMGVARVAGVFPNLALDQTAGARVKVADGQNVGLFGGVTQTPRLFGQGAIASSLSGDKFKLKTDPGVDAAPHASVAAWGRLPYLSNARYEVSAGQQWNPWTTVRTLSASASADAGGATVGAFAKHDVETGQAMEFARNKSSAGLSLSPTPGVDVAGSVFADSARYGSAQIDSRGVWLGLTLTEAAPGAGRGGSVTMTSLFGGEQALVSRERQSDFVRHVQLMLDLARGLKDAGLGSAGGPDRAWDRLRRAWEGLDPSIRQLIDEAWNEYNPGAPPLSKILAVKPDDIAALNRFVDLLADTRVAERLLVRYLRSRVLEELESVEVPVLGKNVRMTAPMVLAAAHALSLSVSPLPPITERDARESLDAFLLRKLAKRLGCERPEGASDQQHAHDCVIGKLPEGARKDIERQFGGSTQEILRAAVAWPSDVLRREINRLVLQVILAAETLNELSVDGGERVGDLNVRGLMASFTHLDKRARGQTRATLARARGGLEEELARQDQTLRAELSEYGAARLAWLQAEPAWPSNVRVAVRAADWPSLLSVYGDAALFGFILRAKGRMQAAAAGKPARLLISFDPNGFGTVLISADPAEVRLGPKAVDLSHVELPR